MKRITRTKLGMVGAAVTVTALLGVAVIPAAQAADQEHDTRPAATRAGIPAAVDPATDLAAHTPGPEAGWNDSIYFTSEVKAGGHDLGLLVHTMSFPNLDKRTLAFSVTDKDTGWYKNYETTFAKDAYTWSTSGSTSRRQGSPGRAMRGRCPCGPPRRGALSTSSSRPGPGHEVRRHRLLPPAR